ncbi:hypothetical protein L3Q82_012372, partial [Scortum barcoo]
EEQGRRCLLHGEQQVVLRTWRLFLQAVLWTWSTSWSDYYLPCEFTSVVMTAVYVPPHADNNKAMDELYGVIDRTETSRPEAAFIVAGDFNSANLRKVLPRYHQHISCPTPVGKSDHASVLLLPSYRQKLKRDGPVTRTIQQWSDQSDSALRSRTDAYNSGDLEEYSSAERQYRDKVESHYKGSNTRSMWAGLKTLTDYKKKISSAEVMSASLPDELNTFYARFESTSPAVEVQKAQEDHCPPVDDPGQTCAEL